MSPDIFCVLVVGLFTKSFIEGLGIKVFAMLLARCASSSNEFVERSLSALKLQFFDDY